MIFDLEKHGLMPSDISIGLLDNVKSTTDKNDHMSEDQAQSSQNMDIRYTLLSHLFIMAISEGKYDSRARTLIKTIAEELQIQISDVIELEKYIADELRIYAGSVSVQHDQETIGKRNEVESTHRWLYAGAATLVGGAVIGLTAGLAAPLIGAGIGAALTTFGATNGAVGIGAFMASGGGIALITSGGALTGGGTKLLIQECRELR
jgi:hypothetical protein